MPLVLKYLCLTQRLISLDASFTAHRPINDQTVVSRPSKGFFSDYMAVIIRPSSQNKIKQPYHICLFSRIVGLDRFPDFVKMTSDISFDGFINSLPL